MLKNPLPVPFERSEQAIFRGNDRPGPAAIMQYHCQRLGPSRYVGVQEES